jgi:hypothetical protein
MRQLVGQSQRVVASLLGLIWIAQKPQGIGRKGEAGHLGVLRVTKGAKLLGIVESNPFFQVLSGLGKLAKKEQGKPQCIVGLHKGGRVVIVLGQAEECSASSRALLSYLPLR